MPALVASYQKTVLETRIKKFYSVLKQAVETNIAENDSWNETMLTEAYNPDIMEEFFNANYSPYMKTTEVKKLTKGFAVGFPDGSGMYLYKNNAADFYQTRGNTYVIWCVDYKKCKNINESSIATNGKDTFLFWTDGRTELAYGHSRATLLSNCSAGNKTFCSALLQHDGWEVKEDYPIKF